MLNINQNFDLKAPVFNFDRDYFNSVEELNTQILLKQKELEDLKKQFDVYKAKMESLLISQLELLKDHKED